MTKLPENLEQLSLAELVQSAEESLAALTPEELEDPEIVAAAEDVLEIVNAAKLFLKEAA